MNIKVEVGRYHGESLDAARGWRGFCLRFRHTHSEATDNGILSLWISNGMIAKLRITLPSTVSHFSRQRLFFTIPLR